MNAKFVHLLASNWEFVVTPINFKHQALNFICTSFQQDVQNNPYSYLQNATHIFKQNSCSNMIVNFTAQPSNDKHASHCVDLLSCVLGGRFFNVYHNWEEMEGKHQSDM